MPGSVPLAARSSPRLQRPRPDSGESGHSSFDEPTLSLLRTAIETEDPAMLEASGAPPSSSQPVGIRKRIESVSESSQGASHTNLSASIGSRIRQRIAGSLPGRRQAVPPSPRSAQQQQPQTPGRGNGAPSPALPVPAGDSGLIEPTPSSSPRQGWSLLRLFPNERPRGSSSCQNLASSYSAGAVHLPSSPEAGGGGGPDSGGPRLFPRSSTLRRRLSWIDDRKTRSESVAPAATHTAAPRPSAFYGNRAFLNYMQYLTDDYWEGFVEERWSGVGARPRQCNVTGVLEAVVHDSRRGSGGATSAVIDVFVGVLVGNLAAAQRRAAHNAAAAAASSSSSRAAAAAPADAPSSPLVPPGTAAAPGGAAAAARLSSSFPTLSTAARMELRDSTADPVRLDPSVWSASGNSARARASLDPALPAPGSSADAQQQHRRSIGEASLCVSDTSGPPPQPQGARHSGNGLRVSRVPTPPPSSAAAASDDGGSSPASSLSRSPPTAAAAMHQPPPAPSLPASEDPSYYLFNAASAGGGGGGNAATMPSLHPPRPLSTSDKEQLYSEYCRCFTRALSVHLHSLYRFSLETLEERSDLRKKIELVVEREVLRRLQDGWSGCYAKEDAAFHAKVAAVSERKRALEAMGSGGGGGDHSGSALALSDEEDYDDCASDASGPDGPLAGFSMMLRALDDVCTFDGQLNLLLETLNAMTAYMSRKTLHVSQEPDKRKRTVVELVTADDVIPLFIRSVLSANPSRAVTAAQFLSVFTPPTTIKGRTGWALATYTAAVQYIQMTSVENLVLDTSAR